MLKNYIILAHRNPEHLSRMLCRLDDGASRFFIHVDKQADLKPFTNAVQSEKVQWLEERINVIWADFSMVQGILNLMRAVSKTGTSGFTILLSGADYPIKDNRRMNAFLKRNSGVNFITLSEVEPGSQAYEEMFCRRKINRSNERGDYELRPCGVDDSLGCLDTPLLKGDTWFAMNSYTLSKILDFVQSHWVCLYEYYKERVFADETFFQAIVSHLARRDYRIRIQPALTYVDWNPKTEDEKLPRVLGKND